MDSNSNDTMHASQADNDGDAESRRRQPIRRPLRGRMVAGVAAGLARHFNVDVTIVRIAFAALTIIGFTGLPFFGALPLYLGGIPLYLACWLLIPEEGSEHSIVGRFLESRQDRAR
jgi:phage shock protein PspC (stress-responsive transcriptional regulator)